MAEQTIYTHCYLFLALGTILPWHIPVAATRWPSVLWMVPELFPKSSAAKYTACAQSSPRVTPYSGLGQLLSDNDDERLSTPHSPNDSSAASPVYSRIVLQKHTRSTHASSTNQSDTDGAPLSQRSSSTTSDYVINIDGLHAQHPALLDPSEPATPECLVTCRRKTTFEARVRLSAHAKPIYVGRYKSEQAAHDACGRLLRQQTTPRRSVPKSK
ncbi:hypothetical protein H310_03021 [Aphanomyces invadans]|uniref:Uncharacterized protein n=1 Tax=Aphanomyces invadans TaxID=157072 RepID=A0A024UKV6_9STRA|nr:hypothetical protein H310_03021 [Aphanomyces invadans]ETW06899.1 hypothetical protein H310_03021 [Aphanomyces invadans]|eukprot:XP_008864974.1 hypothetical protein H310_03021 [Aphanomyces invadans]